MQRYTVTIAPEDPGGAQTTVTFEVDAGVPRITELTMRAGERSHLAAANIPAIDFDLLLRAVTPPPLPTQRSSSDREATALPGAAAERPGPARGSSASRRRGRSRDATGRRAGPSNATTKQARVYRPMPDDFVSRYGGETMAQLADAYGVPMHTVKAWIHTARKQGRIPPSQLRRPGRG